MTEVGQSPAVQQLLSNQFAQAASDGRITGREARELNGFIDQMSLSAEDKTALKNMVSELKDATNNRFLFFSWKSEVSDSEMAGLQRLGQTNSLAKKMLEQFQASSPAPEAPATTSRVADRSRVGGYQRSNFEPNGGGLFNRLSSGNARAASQASGPTASRGTAPSWLLTQNTGLRSSGGDCGPATAAMVAKRFGFLDGADSRAAVQAARNASGVTSPRNGQWAITEAEVRRSVESMTGGQVRMTAQDSFRSGQGSDLTNTLRQRLANGDMPILLTGSPSSNFRHYMVVTEVKPNGNLVMADPAGQGYMWEMTPDKLAELMTKADSRGGSHILSFNRATQAQ